MSTMPQKFGNDPYGLLASGLPPELAAQARGLTREQAIAEALMAQSQKPMETNRMAGGYVIRNSPLEGIAKIAQAYMAHKGLKDSDKKFADLSTQYQTGQSNAMADYIKTRSGEPGRAPVLDPQELEQQDDLGTPKPPNVGAVKADPRKAIQDAMMNPYLAKNPMVASDLKQFEPKTLGRSMVIPATGETVATDSTWQAEQDANRTAKLEAIEAAAREGRITREEADKRAADLRREMQRQSALDRENQLRVAASLRPPRNEPAAPAITAVTIQDPDNPNGTIVIDGRTRQVLGKGPKLTEAGKMENKRQFNMQGIGQTIQRADDILSGLRRGADGVTTSAPMPTGSGIGNVVDQVGAVFGASPAGSVQAQEIKAVGAALTSKMPRMEGPQSDKDVQLYKESAAEVGNPNVPVARRKAALQTVKDLWAKYERLNPDAFADRRAGDEPPPGAVRPRQ